VTARPKTLYFDVPGRGPAPGTSHPAFRRVCKDALFYALDHEFAPFGSDAGADTLLALERWFRGKRVRPVAQFIATTLRDWGMTLPDLAETRPAVVERWLADDRISTMLDEIDGLLIATAVGQLKIAGVVDADVLALALAALAREELSTAYWKVENPRWRHARAATAAHRKVRVALEAMQRELAARAIRRADRRAPSRRRARPPARS
jgi:uncharacterized protein YfeS